MIVDLTGELYLAFFLSFVCAWASHPCSKIVLGSQAVPCEVVDGQVGDPAMHAQHRPTDTTSLPGLGAPVVHGRLPTSKSRVRAAGQGNK